MTRIDPLDDIDFSCDDWAEDEVDNWADEDYDEE